MNQIQVNADNGVISVIIPCFNQAKFLHESVESVTSQTHRQWECIIIDDGSTDDSADVCRNLIRKYSSCDIKLITKNNGGSGSARNAGLRIAKGDYFLLLDADDKIAPDTLEKFKKALDDNPDVGFAYSDIMHFGFLEGYYEQPDFDAARLINEDNIVSICAMVRRQVWKQAGGFNENMRQGYADWDFWISCVEKGWKGLRLPEPLFHYRVTVDPESRTDTTRRPYLISRIRLNHPTLFTTEQIDEARKIVDDWEKHNKAAVLQKRNLNKVNKEKNSSGWLSGLSSVFRKKTGNKDKGISPLPKNYDSPRPKETKPTSSAGRLSIVHTVEFYAPHLGGAEEVIKQLSERLAARGHDVTVATSKLPERTFKELNGVKIEEFDVSGSLVNGYKGRDIARYKEFLRETKADVVMNYAAQQWGVDLAFETLRHTADKRVNIIAPCGYSALKDPDTLAWPNFKDYFLRVIPQYLPQYDAAVYHSASYQDYKYAQNHNFTNSIVIPNGACEDEFLREIKIDFRRKYEITTKFFGLCVANFYGGKGHDNIIECVRQMNRPDFTMVLIGRHGEQLEKLRQQAAGLNVKFCVGIGRDDVLAAFRQADVFLFGSQKECSPLVILEAKASRLPFVSTDCGNVRDWTGGVVCAPEKMALYTNRILDDETLHKTLSEDGFKQWKENYTWESVVNRYEGLYMSLHRRKTAKISSKTICKSSLENKDSIIDSRDSNLVSLIFSKDRAMQLQATLESFNLHCRDADVADTIVLYKASNPVHRGQYEKLKGKFPAAVFIEETDFRRQTLSAVSRGQYVLFLVDDNIFVKPFLLKDVTSALDLEKKALGFSLRLGKNTGYCYSLASQQKLPSFERLGESVLKYYWPDAECDFGYPLEVSSSVYRSGEILQLLNRLEFTNPNALEDMLSRNKNIFASTRPELLTFEESVTFCNPVNMVQRVCKNNRFGTVHNYTSQDLADRFCRDIAIDVQKYAGFTPNAAHQEVDLYFTPAGRVISQEQVVSGDNRGKRVSKPKFSVVMANYNNSKYIDQAVKSVINQTFSDWELIIVDDCSTDDSVAHISRYLSDSRIRLIRHHVNYGYTTALKTGIAAVESDFFGILDSDDALSLDAVGLMYKYHVDYPDCGFIYSYFMWCDTALKPVHGGFSCEIPEGFTALDFDAVSHFKTFKLRDYYKTSGYDENILYAEDRDIIYKMEEVTKLKLVPRCLYYYRELPNSQSHNPRKAIIGRKSTERAKSAARKRRGQDIHSIYERYETGKRNGNPYISRFPLYRAKDNPLVSVWMAAYNSAEYIERAIESALIQNYRNFELIIVDDGSTDRTADIVRRFTGEPVKYFFKEHGGLASVRNVQLKQSSGSYIVILDSDDMLAPDFIAKHLQVFEAHPDTDIVYCDDYLVDEQEDHLRVIGRPEYNDKPGLLLFDTFRLGFPVIPFRTCIKRSVFDKTGPYDEHLLVAEDYDMMRRFIKAGLSAYHLPEPLYIRRMTSAGNSRNFTKDKAKCQLEAVRRFTETFAPEQLFPEVRWNTLPDRQRVLMAKYRTALVYIGIGDQYLTAKVWTYSSVAYEMACAELDECCRMAPNFRLFSDMLEKCREVCASHRKIEQKLALKKVKDSHLNSTQNPKLNISFSDNKEAHSAYIRDGMASNNNAAI